MSSPGRPKNDCAPSGGLAQPGAGAISPLLRKLRAVAGVSEAGSSVLAGQWLHLSQSAVVRAVQDVESAVQLTLFERSARGMRATPIGQRVAQRVSRALDHLARCDAQGAHPWQRSRLAIGVSHRHLEAFLRLVQHGDRQRAAQAGGTSAPALHQSLTQLEHMAGGPLLDRASRGVRLTERGDSLHRGVRLALAELEQAGQELAAQRGQSGGRLVIGTLPFSTGLFLPRALDAVLAAHPGLTVSVVDGTFEALVQQLRVAEIDCMVGALRAPQAAPGLRQLLLFDDDLAPIVRPGHPLAGRRLPGLAALAGLRWALPMPGSPAREALEQAFLAQGLEPPPATLQINSAVVMAALVAESDHVAWMSPRQLEREIRGGLLAVLDVPSRHAPRRIGVTLREDYLPTPAAESLLQAFQESCRPLEVGLRG